MVNVRIREKAFIARIAALLLKTEKVAIVFGQSILLWNTSRQEFLNNKRWLRHELAHIAQYRKHGFFTFILLYAIEWLQHGYYRNKFEIDARAQENLPPGFDYKLQE